MKKNTLTIIILGTIIFLTSVTFVFAWLIQNDTISGEKTIGEVDVKADIYFENPNKLDPSTNKPLKINPKRVEIIKKNFKKNVYLVEVDNKSSDYIIDNLRVSFVVNSSVDTYFRVRVIDTLTIKRTLNDGKIVEQALTKREPVNYVIHKNNNDEDLWFFDNTSSWNYFMNKVKKETTELVVPFIVAGLNYDLMPIGQYIQFAVQIEATQSIKGPINNWGLVNKPWGGEW